MRSINRIEQIERLNVKQPHEWIADHGDGWSFCHLHDTTLGSYLDVRRGLANEKPFVIVVRVAFADNSAAEQELFTL